MREENITRVALDPNNPSKGQTDWEQVDAMTEEEIQLSDPDAQPVTPKELEEFKPVNREGELQRRRAKDVDRPRCHNYRWRA